MSRHARKRRAKRRRQIQKKVKELLVGMEDLVKDCLMEALIYGVPVKEVYAMRLPGKIHAITP